MRTVVLPIESSRESGRDFLKGIAKYSRLHGPWTFYWEPGGLDEVFPRLKNLNADGIIMRDSERLEEVLRLGFPVIVFGHNLERIPNFIPVITDSRNIGKMAAEHLLNCGFANFAYCGFDDISWSIERSVSFRNNITKAGFETSLYKQPAPYKKLTWEKEQHFLVEWLMELPKPVGLMTCNDDRSQQVVQACKIANLKVPEDVAIIGVDNDELICDLSDPPLTSVALNFERAGYEGAQILDRLMEGKQVNVKEITIYATHIVTRQSTDITAIEDVDVANAISFIRNHARESVRVDDVVNAIPLSRRVLEKRFRKHLNRSILEEIRRVRTNQISQLLVETNMTISQISISLGFNGDEHIARYFRKEKGMSLLNYRKQFGRK
jgi:LacI family transcriptional regulator